MTAAVILVAACKKETLPIIVGNYYNVKSNVFRPGQYQPVNPVRVDSLYIDPISGHPYALCFARRKNTLYAYNDSLNTIVVVAYDTSRVHWQIPQNDLDPVR